MELCATSLEQRYAHTQLLSAVDRMRIAHEIAMGLQFLHSKHIVHGDVKVCAATSVG